MLISMVFMLPTMELLSLMAIKFQFDESLIRAKNNSLNLASSATHDKADSIDRQAFDKYFKEDLAKSLNLCEQTLYPKQGNTKFSRVNLHSTYNELNGVVVINASTSYKYQIPIMKKLKEQRVIDGIQLSREVTADLRMRQ